MIVRTHDQGSACGFPFKDGSDYLVYAYSKNGEWWTDTCTGTHKIETGNDDADVQWIRGLAKAPRGGTIFGAVHKSSPPGGDDPPLYAPLSNIKITVTGPVSKDIITDASGQFRTTALPPGTYTVSAVAPTGYTAFPSTKVSVNDRGCAEASFDTRLDGHIRGQIYFSNGAPEAGLHMTAKSAENIDVGLGLGFNITFTTSGNDGSFDFGPLAPGRYVFGVNVDFPSSDDRYYRKAFYPGVTERSQAGLVQIGQAQTVDDLRFFLPEDLPEPSIPLQVNVIGRDGKPIPNAEIFPEDYLWEDSHTSGEPKKTDSEGKANLLLRKGAYYNVWAGVSLSDSTQACTEPVGVLAEEGLKPVMLIVSHSFGNCSWFAKPHQ
jgi:carboxypeptidase family protein